MSELLRVYWYRTLQLFSQIFCTVFFQIRVFDRHHVPLEGGVLLNVGTAVMGPEVYLKALSMARNVARRGGREIRRFTTAVFDLLDLPEDIHAELPKTEPGYYYRPLKTILVRTVADGGESFYFKGRHEVTIPNLARLVVQQPI